MGAIFQGSRMILPTVKADDAGIYMCRVNNTNSTEAVTNVLVVTGLVPAFNTTEFLQLDTLDDAYLEFEVDLSFRPRASNGMILYNGQSEQGGDFVSFGLNDNGIPEFRFNLGSGTAVISGSKPLALNEWHTVKIVRNRRNGTMIVDGSQRFTGSIGGKFQGLDLMTPLYIGGHPDFSRLPKDVGFTNGFDGCVSQVKIKGKSQDLAKLVTVSGLSTCRSCETGTGSEKELCENGGHCQEANTPRGHRCICQDGYSGERCQKMGLACYPGKLIFFQS